MKALALGLLFFAAGALACQGGEETPTDSLAHAVKEAKYVFFARVIGARPDEKNRTTIVTLKPYVQWKGTTDEQVAMDFQTGRSCDIGRFAEKGSTWFVVAGENKSVPTQSHSRRIWNLVEEQNLRTKVTDAVGHSAN